jgi:hypothetical protein
LLGRGFNFGRYHDAIEVLWATRIVGIDQGENVLVVLNTKFTIVLLGWLI